MGAPIYIAGTNSNNKKFERIVGGVGTVFGGFEGVVWRFIIRSLAIFIITKKRFWASSIGMSNARQIENFYI